MIPITFWDWMRHPAKYKMRDLRMGYWLWRHTNWGWHPWRPCFPMRHPGTREWYTVFAAVEMPVPPLW